MTLFEKSLDFLLYILLAVCKENLDIKLCNYGHGLQMMTCWIVIKIHANTITWRPFNTNYTISSLPSTITILLRIGVMKSKLNY